MNIILSGDYVKIVRVFSDEDSPQLGKKAIAVESHYNGFSDCWRVRLANGNKLKGEGKLITASVEPWIEVGDWIGVAIYDTEFMPYDRKFVFGCCAQVTAIAEDPEEGKIYSFACSGGITKTAREEEVWKLPGDIKVYVHTIQHEVERPVLNQCAFGRKVQLQGESFYWIHKYPERVGHKDLFLIPEHHATIVEVIPTQATDAEFCHK